jgi:hypothetical protein
MAITYREYKDGEWHTREVDYFSYMERGAEPKPPPIWSRKQKHRDVKFDSVRDPDVLSEVKFLICVEGMTPPWVETKYQLEPRLLYRVADGALSHIKAKPPKNLESLRKEYKKYKVSRVTSNAIVEEFLPYWSGKKASYWVRPSTEGLKVHVQYLEKRNCSSRIHRISIGEREWQEAVEKLSIAKKASWYTLPPDMFVEFEEALQILLKDAEGLVAIPVEDVVCLSSLRVRNTKAKKLSVDGQAKICYRKGKYIHVYLFDPKGAQSDSTNQR